MDEEVQYEVVSLNDGRACVVQTFVENGDVRREYWSKTIREEYVFELKVAGALDSFDSKYWDYPPRFCLNPYWLQSAYNTNSLKNNLGALALMDMQVSEIRYYLDDF